MIAGNKGEWSEIYTLFKILGDKALYPGDGELRRIGTMVYPILNVLRTEASGSFKYTVEDDTVVVSAEKELCRIPVEEFKNKAKLLFEAIKKHTGVFSVPEIAAFMERINCFSLKAGSSAKTDITIVVHDQRTGFRPVLGYSIKSQIGGASTLLNAGQTTNFIYRIDHCSLTDSQINEINNIDTGSKLRDRIAHIVGLGGELIFTSIERSTFENNLVLIDSCLPAILSKCVYLFYSSDLSKTADLVQSIASENFLHFNIEKQHPYYSYKIKRFLTDTALGMMPSKVWTGKIDATGGYLIVKNDGEILCYHMHSRNEFEDYLFANTKFETASSTRHNFGNVYKDNGNLFIKLNLQIRFL